MPRMAVWAVMGCIGLLGASLPAAAQDNEDLRKEVEALKEKVKGLEADKAPVSEKRDDTSLMKLDDDRTVLDILLAETKLGGFVEAGYIFNLNRPLGTDNTVMPFTNGPRNFYLHNAQLELKRDPTPEFITGYNVQLSMGSDANVFGTADSDLTEYFDLQEANIQILAPIGNGVTFTIGKFVTLSGYEVIETKDNYNYTHSLPFFWAIPFTHTGVRAAYSFTDQVKVTLGVNNGWDVMNDNNDAKTLEFQLALTPIEWLALYGNFYYGAENGLTPSGRTPGQDRMLIDLVAVASNIPGLKGFTFGANLDIAEQEEASNVTAGDDAEWLGFAVYGKYQIDDDWALAVRFSMMSDDEGFRLPGAFDPVTGLRVAGDNDVSEITVTVERRISKDTIVRGEIRFDMSDEDIFLDHNEPEDSQTIFGVDFILTF